MRAKTPRVGDQDDPPNEQPESMIPQQENQPTSEDQVGALVAMGTTRADFMDGLSVKSAIDNLFWLGNRRDCPEAAKPALRGYLVGEVEGRLLRVAFILDCRHPGCEEMKDWIRSEFAPLYKFSSPSYLTELVEYESLQTLKQELMTVHREILFDRTSQPEVDSCAASSGHHIGPQQNAIKGSGVNGSPDDGVWKNCSKCGVRVKRRNFSRHEAKCRAKQVKTSWHETKEHLERPLMRRVETTKAPNVDTSSPRIAGDMSVKDKLQYARMQDTDRQTSIVRTSSSARSTTARDTDDKVEAPAIKRLLRMICEWLFRRKGKRPGTKKERQQLRYAVGDLRIHREDSSGNPSLMTLLKRGIDVDAAENKFMIVHSVGMGDAALPMTKLLVEHGANLYRLYDGKTLLQRILDPMYCDNEATIAYLRGMGVSEIAPNEDDGQNPN